MTNYGTKKLAANFLKASDLKRTSERRVALAREALETPCPHERAKRVSQIKPLVVAGLLEMMAHTVEHPTDSTMEAAHLYMDHAIQLGIAHSDCPSEWKRSAVYTPNQGRYS